MTDKGGAARATTLLLQDHEGVTYALPRDVVERYRIEDEEEVTGYDLGSALNTALVTAIWIGGDVTTGAAAQVPVELARAGRDLTPKKQ